MRSKKNETAGVGGIAGFSAPIGIKKRKKKVDELLELNEDVSMLEVLSFFSSLSEDETNEAIGMLESNEYVALSKKIKERHVRNAMEALVRKRVREIVRKLPNGKYGLYAPNPGKKGQSKKVGEFSTRLAAKRSELQRFPPQDPSALANKRKELEKLRKKPELAAIEKPAKKEAIERLAKSIAESIFREEKEASSWDEYVGKLSKDAVLSDKKFQSLQKSILKSSEKALNDAVSMIDKELKKSSFSTNKKGVKKDEGTTEMFIEFSVGDTKGAAEVGPLYVTIENGYPKIDVSSQAKSSFMGLDPERNKLLRSELMSIQEDMLDSVDTVKKSVNKRDDYLNKMEKKIDNFVADLTSIEISMLKRVLMEKYRKLGR